MKARNKKKEEEFKRQKQKHIQSAFYETTGSKSGGIKNSKQRRRNRYKNQQISATKLNSNVSTSTITYKRRGNKYKNNMGKRSKNSNSLPYLHKERMTQSYNMERNSHFPQRRPEQYGYETKLHDHEKHTNNIDLNKQREAGISLFQF